MRNRIQISDLKKKLVLPALLVVCALALTGCSFMEFSASIKQYFEKEVMAEEQTPGVSLENQMTTVTVQNPDGEELTNADGENLTLMAVYETASGGEARINERGIAETWPVGQVMTYEAGMPVTLPDGTQETYAGGETVPGFLGIPEKDKDGNPVTRAAGEVVTHGDSDIIYDEEGNKVYSKGEPLTYAPGETMYTTDGKKASYPVMLVQNEDGEALTDEDGELLIRRIEIATNPEGEPILEENGEVATKNLEPEPIEKVIEQPVKEGNYYIRNIQSSYVYFSTPLVPAANIHVPEGADPDPEAKTPETAESEEESSSAEVVYTAPEEHEAAADLQPEQTGNTEEAVVTEESAATGEAAVTEEPAATGEAAVTEEPAATGEAAATEETGMTQAQPDTASETEPSELTETTQEVPEETGETQAETTEELSESAPSEEGKKKEERMVENLQLEVLGEDLPYFELRFDPEGYGYFVLEGSDMVLGFEGTLRNGANILLQEMDKKVYPQYMYWEDPLYTLPDHQKWIIRKLEDDSVVIMSAADQNYVMTVDDEYGIQFANLMLWTFDDRELQKFVMQTDTPKVETYLEEGDWFIRTGCSSYMLASIGDFNYDEGRALYIYPADGQDGQIFKITYDEYGLATIAHSDSAKVLTVENGQAVNYNPVVQSEADGKAWQKWILEPVPDDTGYVLRSALNVSEVLNLKGGVAAQDQPVTTYWNDNTFSQRWYFSKEIPEGAFTYQSMQNYAQNFSSATGWLMLINNTTNHVGIYSGSQGNWTCVQYWDCVTGKASTPTVRGEFTVMGRVPSFDGDTDAPAMYTCYYATMFYPAYFFHSIIYYKGTRDIMDATMGWNASHGCVRLYIDNAQWIYENIPDGTKVVSF